MSRQWTTSSYQSSQRTEQIKNVEGELFDILGDQAATLQWSNV